MESRSKHLGSKPTGLRGTLLGHLMNAIHAKSYERTIREICGEMEQAAQPLSVLDVGCGGGKTIQLFCRNLRNCRACGIDHSSEMVRLSRRTNREFIEQNRAEILQGSAADLPLADCSHDVVTAFDTINLWDDIDASVAEIHRVLSADGVFVVVNGYPEEGSKWWHIVKFKSVEEYAALFERHGFVVTRASVEKRVVTIVCKKK